MDKYLIRPKSTLELLEDSDIISSKPVVLGVIGNSSNSFWNKETLLNSVLSPILDELGSLQTLILSNEGHTSLLLQSWASSSKTNTSVYDADWKSLGRKARVLRDSRILKEATHLLFFLGARSDYYEKIAIREVKKGKIVYTVDPSSHDLVLWEL